jgi:hypothetical protein
MDTKRLSVATMAAAIMAAAGMVGSSEPETASRKPRRRVPTMVCSPQAEIAAWNADVAARSDRRARIFNRRRDRDMAREFADNGQRPKFAKPRTHKQHVHRQRDEHGAYTLIGSAYEVEGMEPDASREHVTSAWTHGDDFGYAARRKWLAGISAQRGY